jgi:rhamnose transport system permease protein
VVEPPSSPADYAAPVEVRSSPLRAVVRWETLLVGVLVGTILYGVSVSPAFWTSTTAFYVGLNMGEVAIMALPVALIVITGEIDLSIAATLGLTGVVMAEAFMHGWSIWLSMAAALVVGGLCGAFNGFLVTGLGLPSLAVTIGTLTLFRGISQGILPNDTIQVFQAPFSNIGVLPIRGTQIAWSVLFFAILAVVIGVVLHATPLGRSIYAIGAGREAAFFAGIRVNRIKFWLFVLSGVLSGFAGILWTLRFASARYDSGAGQELLVVTIVLLGGISIFGGRGTIVGVVLAAAILGCLQTSMTLDQISAQNQNIVVGSLLIVSVVVPSAGDLYRRARLRLRSALARRRRDEAAAEAA